MDYAPYPLPLRPRAPHPLPLIHRHHRLVLRRQSLHTCLMICAVSLRPSQATTDVATGYSVSGNWTQNFAINCDAMRLQLVFEAWQPYVGLH